MSPLRSYDPDSWDMKDCYKEELFGVASNEDTYGDWSTDYVTKAHPLCPITDYRDMIAQCYIQEDMTSLLEILQLFVVDEQWKQLNSNRTNEKHGQN